MFQIPELLEYKNLFHAFSTKADGNMANTINGKNIDFTNVVENRKRFLNKIGIDLNNTVCIWVQHGDEVVVADPKVAGISMTNKDFAAKVDGMITDKKGLYMFLLIADCLPIIFYDPKKKAIALVHAGWKGVDLEIVKKTVGCLSKQYKTNPEDLIVGIGPCVHKDSFIKESPLQKDDPRWQAYLEKVGEDKYAIDLVGFIKKQLISVGVKEKNIFDSGVDTAKDKRFYSHVREKNMPIETQGRFAGIVGIR